MNIASNTDKTQGGRREKKGRRMNVTKVSWRKKRQEKDKDRKCKVKRE